MADGIIQVPADDVGKKVDTSELARPDGTVVERQRISIGDSGDQRKIAAVEGGELSVNDEWTRNILCKILATLEDIRETLWSVRE
jgi:hypothetical protein